MKVFRLFIAVAVALSVLSCEHTDKSEDNNSIARKGRDELYDIMQEWYYWYDLMPSVDRKNYSNPYELLEALRIKDLDVWSFVADYEDFMASMYKGEFRGYGISMAMDYNCDIRITYIFNESSLYGKGVRRGWILESLNGCNLKDAVLRNDAKAYNNAFSAQKGSFVFIGPKGDKVKIEAEQTSFKSNTVLCCDTLHLSSGIAGHLVFESFTRSAIAELESAFQFFKETNVTDLILDLRYNSGGMLDVAQELASYVLDNHHSSSVFCSLSFNDKNPQKNESNNFKEVKYPLDLKRIVIIGSRLTASASEAVINGLDPFVEVTLVGDTTYGKPMGMSGWSYADTYYFFPVTFKLVNANGVGDYYKGFPPEIIAPDDITRDFNNREEACLKAAIQYLETGAVSRKGDIFHKIKFLTDKPFWKNNVIANPK